MSDDVTTEATFDIDDPPARVWEALVDLRARADDRPEGPTWWLPGFASTAVEVAVEVERELVVTKADEPCAGTRILVRLEHEVSGSRITVVQSGFDPGFVEATGEQFWLHAERIFADLHLWLRTGVEVGRAWRWPTVDLGWSAMTVPGGVGVADLRAGGWADRAGLRVGDVVVDLAGASIYDLADLGAVTQTLQAGQAVPVRWVQAGSLREATTSLP